MDAVIHATGSRNTRSKSRPLRPDDGFLFFKEVVAAALPLSSSDVASLMALS